MNEPVSESDGDDDNSQSTGKGSLPVSLFIVAILCAAGIYLFSWWDEEGTDGADSLPQLTLAQRDGSLAELQRVVASRPAMINLWASWCSPCLEEMPLFEAAQSRHPDMAFIYVNNGEDLATINSFLNRTGFKLDQVLTDPAQQLMKSLQLNVLPVTVFYAADGQRVALHKGQLDASQLEGYLEITTSRLAD